MEKIFLGIILFFCLASPVSAYDIVVLKSRSSAPYITVAEAFEEKFVQVVPSRGVKSVIGHRFYGQTLDKTGNGELDAFVADHDPDLIVALGRQALEKARRLNNVPIVYCLVADPEKIIGDYPQATGINLTIPPGLQFSEVKRLLPRVKKVGVLYDPRNSADLIGRAREVLQDIELIALEVESSAKVASLLDYFQEKIDLLWMVPDLTVVNSKTLRSYFLFSFKNKIPILAFSDKYIEPGAALAVGLDLSGIGRSAAEQAALILQGVPIQNVPPRDVDQVKTRVNPVIMKKLNIPVAEGLL